MAAEENSSFNPDKDKIGEPIYADIWKTNNEQIYDTGQSYETLLKQHGIIIVGSSGAGKEYKRKEDATDKDRLERLTVLDNKKEDGYYSEDEGFISFEYLSELKELQKALIKIGIEASLQEAENFWSSYCQDEHFAGWIKFSDFDNSFKEESIKYAFSYFYD